MLFLYGDVVYFKKSKFHYFTSTKIQNIIYTIMSTDCIFSDHNSHASDFKDGRWNTLLGLSGFYA